MQDKNFTTSIEVDHSLNEVFKAVNEVRAWWSESIDGKTDQLNSEFLYHYQDVHISKMKIVEFVQDKKVVWLVLNNHFSFTKDKSEWVNTKIIFDISAKNGKTKVAFTHEGLVPQYECYKICNDAWTGYIQGSLKSLIETGKGKPNTKEEDLNAELIEKWGLPSNAEVGHPNFTKTFTTTKSPSDVFGIIKDVRKWWVGLFGEEIEGSSTKLNDEFTFKAGEGMHYTKHKVIELVPDKRIVWLVTESNLSFAKKVDEWTNTKMCFEISVKDNKTHVSFAHQGLIPKLECYNNCSAAWSQYLDILAKKLK